MQNSKRFMLMVNDIWVVGNNQPNTSVLDAYNPDIILAKYVQADNGLSATLLSKKDMLVFLVGTRSDNVTSLS